MYGGWDTRKKQEEDPGWGPHICGGDGSQGTRELGGGDP